MRKVLILQIFIFLGTFNFLSSMDIYDDEGALLTSLSDSFQELSSILKEEAQEDKQLSALNKKLAKAIRAGDVVEIKKLLKNGAQIDMVNTPKTGNSALHLAVLAPPKKTFEIIELALKKGAQKNARGKDGRTFLYTFISNYTEDSFAEFAACIWLYDIDLSVIDKEGNTLFHAAAEAGRLDWVVFLLGLFECKFESEDKLLNFLLLLQAKNGIKDKTPEDERETAAQLAKRLGIYFQKVKDFNKSNNCSKIAEVIEKEIALLNKKWEKEKQSLSTSLDYGEKKKMKKEIKKKMKKHYSVGEHHY